MVEITATVEKACHSLTKVDEERIANKIYSKNDWEPILNMISPTSLKGRGFPATSKSLLLRKIC